MMATQLWPRVASRAEDFLDHEVLWVQNEAPESLGFFVGSFEVHTRTLLVPLVGDIWSLIVGVN